MTRETVGRLERGELGPLPLDVVRSVTTALGMRIDVRARWQGGDLDRVMNANHAALHESLARHLESLPGWIWRPEVSFSIYGERGVVDILAWHSESRSLLIIELKTLLVDPQELTATMGRRVRLGRRIAEEQGWKPVTVSAWVVVQDGSTNRRRGAAHAGILRAAFPLDGRAMRRWLRDPVGRVSVLSFWSDVAPTPVRTTTTQTRRVRRPASGQSRA